MFGLSYWFLPAFAGTVWLGTLLGMLLYWVTAGEPHYSEMGAGQRIAYISDIGATFLQPLFIAGSTTMVVIFDLAFISERWLRHKGRLTHNYAVSEKVLSIFAIIFAIVGAAGLILLSIFDTKQYPTVHDSMLVVFIAGYVISAIFICAEYQRLGIHFREYRILRVSFWIKLAFIFIEVALAIAFGVLEFSGHYNSSAILEWTISLIYIFCKPYHTLTTILHLATANDHASRRLLFHHRLPARDADQTPRQPLSAGSTWRRRDGHGHASRR